MDMIPNDDKLRALLKQWRDIEPAGNFEANVRRRIRLAATVPARTSWRVELLWRPAFATAAALVLSVVIGAWAGMTTVNRQQVRAELQFMSAGTLAGGYARLTLEERR
jgi:hypothetical protein